MPTLIIDNMPASLLERIEGAAKLQRRSPADTALEVLESAFRTTTAMRTEAPLPQEPFLTEDICAPCNTPWPERTPVHAIQVPQPLPTPHDIPDEEQRLSS